MNEKNDPNVQIIENATRDDVRPGDHITWELNKRPDGATITERREGTAHHRDSFGDWWTDEGGVWLTLGAGEGVTITIRRPVQDVPTEPGTVIVPAEGREFIEAVVGGIVWYANEAVLGPDARWHGIWRGGWGSMPIGYVAPGLITPGTWKVDEK